MYEHTGFGQKTLLSKFIGWSAGVLVMAWVCWILGAGIAIWQGVHMSRYDVGSAAIPVVAGTVFWAFALGAILWAISHLVLALGHIEENTRSASRTE